MMQSIYNKEITEKFISRILSLQEDSKSLWGKMTVSQMLVHTQKSFQMATGELLLNRVMISYVIGPIAKRTLLNNKPFSKNLPTDKNLVVNGSPEFEVEKLKLIELIEKMVSDGHRAITKHPHPFFGKMNAKEWDALLYKHLDHHLRQFGV